MNLTENDFRSLIVLGHFPKFNFAEFPENIPNKNKVFSSQMAAHCVGSLLLLYVCMFIKRPQGFTVSCGDEMVEVLFPREVLVPRMSPFLVSHS